MDKKKKKFKPTITRVKLNPEQAVLSCTCYDGGRDDSGGFDQGSTSNDICSAFSTKSYTSSNFVDFSTGMS